jgi:PAS domain S-box-containing protein
LSPTFPRAVAVLPVDGPLSGTVRELLSGAGIPIVETVTAGLDVAVVDLDAPGADRAQQELLDKAPRAAILGVAEPTPRAASPLVLDIVAPEALSRELVLRLERLRFRLTILVEAQQRQRDLQVLLELTARYAEASDVDELFHDVTRRLADEFDIDRVAFLVVDAEKNEGTIVAASDDAGLKDLRIDLSRYPEVREVLRTGKPVILEDAPSHPLLEDVKEAVAAKKIQVIAAFPLAVRGQVQGVLLMRRLKQGQFSAREVEFLTTASYATAVAFRNVRQLESVRVQRERERSARIAAEEHAAQLKRYAAYFEHLSDGVAIVDSRCTVLSLNPAGLKLLDAETHAAVGRHINAIANPHNDAVLYEMLSIVAKGEVRNDVEVVARTLAGRRVILSVSAAPLAGDVGDGFAILTLRDVTRQREMADELRQTSDFLERLIGSSVDAIIAADMRGTVILFNKAAESICGHRASDIVGKLHVTKLYPDGVARQIMKQLRSGESGGRGRLATSRFEILSKTGDRIPVNMTASILYEGQTETATVGIFTDLRDRLNLERRLTDAEARLLESEKKAVLVALAGTAAHELNQPLTSIMGYAEFLKRKLKDADPLMRPVDIIFREAGRMAEIVKKIGKITKFETKTYVGTQRIVDLDKAVAGEE